MRRIGWEKFQITMILEYHSCLTFVELGIDQDEFIAFPPLFERQNKLFKAHAIDGLFF